jgi:hypothetical protein
MQKTTVQQLSGAAGGYLEVFPEGAITLANARGFTQIGTESDWSNPKKGGPDPFQDLLNDLLAWIEGDNLHGLTGEAVWRQPSCISDATNRRSAAIVSIYRFRTRTGSLWTQSPLLKACP